MEDIQLLLDADYDTNSLSDPERIQSKALKTLAIWGIDVDSLLPTYSDCVGLYPPSHVCNSCDK